MTREEAKYHLEWIPHFDEEKFVDEIYDDIESRVCKNCKHYNMDTAVYYCDTYDIIMINSDHTIRTVDEYFGCNKFEVESK